MRSTFLVIFISLFSKFCYSQQALSDQSYFCNPEPLITSDTLAKRIAVDSIRNLLIGEWELIELEIGWSKNRKPSVSTKIKINKNGYIEYLENGVVASSCYIDLFLHIGFFLYQIRDLKGKAFIRLAPKNNGRLVYCENKLVLNNSRGDGEALYFKRLLTQSR